jgi:hypothetical protein
MRPVEIVFPLLSVTPTENSMRHIDDLIGGAAPCGHEEIRNYRVIISVQTRVEESTDELAQKNIDEERLRYIEQYIRRRQYPTSWIKGVYAENRTNYTVFFTERLRAPNYNYIEVSPTY